MTDADEPYDPNPYAPQVPGYPPTGYPPPSYPAQYPAQYPQTYPAQYPQTYPAQYPQTYPAQYPQSHPAQYPQSHPLPYPQNYAQPAAPSYAAPAYPGQPGYRGQPGYPSYPGYPPLGNGRPGVATAANVLAFVNGGLLIIAGLLLFLGAAAINSVDDLGGPSHHLLSAELTVDGLLDLVASGMLIAGGVLLGNRRARGRVLLAVGGGIVLGESVYWLIRTEGIAVFWALLFAALVVVSLALAWTSAVTAWLRPPPPS